MVLELLTGLVALFTAITTLALFLLGRRKVKVIEEKVDEVHVLVNSRLTAVLDRVDQLTEAMEASNLPVPDAPRAEKYIR